MHRIVIILGGNLGDVPATFNRCEQRFIEMHYDVDKTSVLYISPAWGYQSDANYYNRIIVLKSNNNPQEVLNDCLNIEIELGRKRNNESTYQDRTIDIDILFYDNEIISNKNLVIPHPRLHERKFCLVPLNEIMPDYTHPLLQKTVGRLLAECKDESNITQA